MTPAEQQAIARRADKNDTMLGLLAEIYVLAGGWREAVGLLEDVTANPVYLKNMLACLNQIDGIKLKISAALKEEKTL